MFDEPDGDGERTLHQTITPGEAYEVIEAGPVTSVTIEEFGSTVAFTEHGAAIAVSSRSEAIETSGELEPSVSLRYTEPGAVYLFADPHVFAEEFDGSFEGLTTLLLHTRLTTPTVSEVPSDRQYGAAVAFSSNSAAHMLVGSPPSSATGGVAVSNGLVVAYTCSACATANGEPLVITNEEQVVTTTVNFTPAPPAEVEVEVEVVVADESSLPSSSTVPSIPTAPDPSPAPSLSEPPVNDVSVDVNVNVPLPPPSQTGLQAFTISGAASLRAAAWVAVAAALMLMLAA